MARASGSTSATGVWKKDSVTDVAESVGIANLPDEVATALAGDVEYRLWEIIEESIKFMRHSRRTRLTVEDIAHALQVRNLEPLWGFASTSHLPFKRTVTATGTVYHVDDEEIDLGKVMKSELPPVPRDVSFTAHWLAIEGVQPLIKENPSPAELAKLAPRPTAPTPANAIASTSQGASSVTPLVKHVLSRELQLYFTRLTEALIMSGESASAMREAALGSVRSDPGLHQLVPYLVAWGGEQIATHLDDLSILEQTLNLFHSMLENPTLFIEPYLHQLTPPILTCLLTSSLPRSTSRPTSLTIRTSASSLLHLLLSRHASSYPSLRPRVTKTLLRGLAGDARGLGGRWGAARGLAGIVRGEGGNKAVREWVGGGLKALGEMCEREEETEEGELKMVVAEVVRVLQGSLLPIESPASTPESPDRAELHERYGKLFGDAIAAKWNDGGRDIYAGIPGGSAAVEAEEEEADVEMDS